MNVWQAESLQHPDPSSMAESKTSAITDVSRILIDAVKKSKAEFKEAEQTTLSSIEEEFKRIKRRRDELRDEMKKHIEIHRKRAYIALQKIRGAFADSDRKRVRILLFKLEHQPFTKVLIDRLGRELGVADITGEVGVDFRVGSKDPIGRLSEYKGEWSLIDYEVFDTDENGDKIDAEESRSCSSEFIDIGDPEEYIRSADEIKVDIDHESRSGLGTLTSKVPMFEWSGEISIALIHEKLDPWILRQMADISTRTDFSASKEDDEMEASTKRLKTSV
jgi:hypothetical protein